MYNSPIEIQIAQMQTQIIKQQEEDMYRAVVSVGVSVDKDELIRALQYDRNQYDKGRTDALAELVRCETCESFCPCAADRFICVSWGSWTDPDGWCYRGEWKSNERKAD